MLWPESYPDPGRNHLSVALSSLRHQLEPPGVPHGAILRADRFSVQLNPEPMKPGTLKLHLGIVILDFEQWKGEELPNA